ncbi:MAG: hypothetical protein ACD_20C00223G0002 [uncultured bacterium]|nr:MAG: hypothetical protein ACD_20C00223G0002 [uncultured bacterium]HBH18592.1 hypothetical protein [Cyanobacteria bacterium UBA9579]
MIKRLLKKITYFRCMDNYPEFNLGSFLVALFCTFLIIIATFTPLKLWILSIPNDAFVHPIDFFSQVKSIADITLRYLYIPQIPAVLFIAAMLGPRIGLFSVSIYIIAGLAGLPIFASGGGIQYATHIVFGYILGYFIAVYLVGNILTVKMNLVSMFKATLVGVFSVHLIGIVYLTIVMLLQQNSIFSVFGWIWAYSGIQILYDIGIGFIAIALARPARAIFWMAMD